MQLLSQLHCLIPAKMKSKEAKNRLCKSERGAHGSLVEQDLQAKRGEQGPKQAASDRNELNMEKDRHTGEVEEIRGDVNVLATKMRQREDELELLRSNASSYIGNILV